MAVTKKTDNNQRVLEAIKEGYHTRSELILHTKGKPKLTSKQVSACLSLLKERNTIFSREINKVSHYFLSINETASLLTSKPWKSGLFLGGSCE